jgi:selenocysteine lyase/cysteine desulfurase
MPPSKTPGKFAPVFLNADPAEIAFGANMTTLTFHLARALGQNYQAGDQIIITELDHHANVAPWQRLAQERGVHVRKIRLIPETGQLDWDEFAEAVTAQTKLVAIGAASMRWARSTILRVLSSWHALGRHRCSSMRALPHALADVRALDCDYLGMSAYKFYGPHIGVLFAKRELFNAIDFPKLIPAPDTGPERAETGTQNQEGMVGAAAAIDFLASLVEEGSGTSPLEVQSNRRNQLSLVYRELHERNLALIERLWNGLAAIKGVRLYGPPPDAPRTPTISFSVEGVASTDVARQLASRGLFLSHGDFYAATVVERLGLGEEGLVRAGCACYTTADEIDD